MVEVAPLPTATRAALSAIVRTMRDVPRALIGDPAEVVHFLNRQARAIERVRDEPIPVALPVPKTGAPPTPAIPAPARALTARAVAEAVFTKDVGETDPLHASARAPGPRTITTRKGRSVRVEVRRARAAGQLEMLL